MKIIDISQRIYDQMPIHPYDDMAYVVQDRSIQTDTYSNTRIHLGMHTGTHIDAPSHLIDGGKQIHQYPLESFVGRGCILDVRGMDTISMRADYHSMVNQGDIVLLFTGYGDIFDEPNYYGDDAPILSNDLAEFFVQKKIKMLGMDMASPDRHPYQIHHLLLDSDILIMENMCNLQSLLMIDTFRVMALPLSLCAEGSITRAIAIVD